MTMTAVPRMLSDLLVTHKVISFTGCMVQFYFYFSLGSTSFLILSDMALDRFVAICHPLHYDTLMSWAVCVRLAGAAWAAPFLVMVPTVLSRAYLNYCHGNIINHFFCDNVPLLQLSCSDTSLLEFWDFMMALAFVLSSFLVTLISYGYIVTTVLRIPSATRPSEGFLYMWVPPHSGLHWLQQHHLPLCQAWQSTFCGNQQDHSLGDISPHPLSQSLYPYPPQ